MTSLFHSLWTGQFYEATKWWVHKGINLKLILIPSSCVEISFAFFFFLFLWKMQHVFILKYFSITSQLIYPSLDDPVYELPFQTLEKLRKQSINHRTCKIQVFFPSALTDTDWTHHKICRNPVYPPRFLILNCWCNSKEDAQSNSLRQ